MRALTVVLSFVFVVHVFGQSYVGRKRGGGKAISPVFPVHPKPVAPIAPHPKPVFGGGMGGLTSGLASLQGGGMLPPHIQQLIGSTINGQPFIGGQGGLPRHGGAGIGERFSNGLRNGWGADGGIAQVQAVSAWEDPLQGHAFPTNYEGGELWFDESAGRYVARQRHNVAKASGIGAAGQMQHDVAKASSGMGMGMGPAIDPIGHDIAKSTGMIGGPGQIQHDIAKTSSGMGMDMGMGMGPAIDPIGHDIAKSGGMIAGPAQIHHDVAKSSSGMGIGQVGGPFGIQGGMGGMQMHHDINKATSGMVVGQVGIGHNIAKATDGRRMVGGGSFVDPIGHDIAKASSGVQVMDPFGPSPVHHGGPSSIMAGRPMFGNPIHNVNKAGASGIPSMGADPLSGQMGHAIAKDTIRESVQIIDMATGGGASLGDPLASAAASGLANEAVHVAGKTLGMASGAARRPVMSSAAVKRISGYQGRQRKPPAMKQW